MCGPIGYRVGFSKRHRLPDGYEVWGEWGETDNGKTGIGCYTWSDRRWDVISEPFDTRWEARRDAIAHSLGPDSLLRKGRSA